MNTAYAEPHYVAKNDFPNTFNDVLVFGDIGVGVKCFTVAFYANELWHQTESTMDADKLVLDVKVWWRLPYVNGRVNENPE